MVEPAIGRQERQLRTHLPKDNVVEEDMCEVAKIIVEALGDGFEAECQELHERSRALTQRYPLYPHLSSP